MNPSDGVVERFACELRALRAAAGEVPFWKMARRCEVSKSALAGAVAGYELPSSRVTRAFVEVCGGDWQWWSERLARARAQLEATCDTPSDDPPKAAQGTALVPVRRALPVKIVTRGELVPRAAFPVQMPAHAAGKQATKRWWQGAAIALAGVAALAIAGLISEMTLHSRAAAAISFSPPPVSSPYDQTVGPGCPHTALAKVTQDDFTEIHKWTQATAARWNVRGCSNLILYSAPTESANPDRWQDDYEWYFDNVPKTARCTFHIYIPDTPYARYTAAYDWTAGDSSYLDSTAFVIDQSAYRGQWFSQGPHTFATGQAMMMLTDARSGGPNVTLAAAGVRLTCK